MHDSDDGFQSRDPEGQALPRPPAEAVGRQRRRWLAPTLRKSAVVEQTLAAGAGNGDLISNTS